MIHNANTQFIVGGERRPKGREELMFKYSCLAIIVEFYFTGV